MIRRRVDKHNLKLNDKMRFEKLLLTTATISAAYFGDYIVFKSRYSESFIFRAISDSFVHGSLGFMSSVMFFSHENHLNTQTCMYNMAFCTLISSLIDVDHLFVAKSLSLKDLSNLKQRGIFHCTTFWLLLTTILLLYSYIQKELKIYILTFMLILAFTSHHLRDANRRGLWLYPFGSSPPIDKNLYIFILAMLPHVLAYSYLMYKEYFTKNVIVNYTTIV